MSLLLLFRPRGGTTITPPVDPGTGASEGSRYRASTGPADIPRIPINRAKKRLEALVRKAKKKKLIPRELALLQQIQNEFPEEVPGFLRLYLLGVDIPFPEIEIPIPIEIEAPLDMSWAQIPPDGIFNTPFNSEVNGPNPYDVPPTELAELDDDEMLLLKLADAEDDEEIVMALAE